MIHDSMIQHIPYRSSVFLIHPSSNCSWIIQSAHRTVTHHVFWLSRTPQLGHQQRPSWNIEMAPSDFGRTQMWQRDSSLKGRRGTQRKQLQGWYHPVSTIDFYCRCPFRMMIYISVSIYCIISIIRFYPEDSSGTIYFRSL